MPEDYRTIFHDHLEQVWNGKDPSGIERYVAPGSVGYDAAEVIAGLEGYKQHFVTLTTAFPDLRITSEIVLAERDRVAARWLVEATHTGRVGDLPPSGRRVRVTGSAIVRVGRGQLVEEHANSDTLGLLRQIGEISTSARTVPLLF